MRRRPAVAQPAAGKNKGSHDRKLVLALIGSGIVIVVLLIVAGMLFWQTKSKESSVDISKRIVAEVSAIYLVPTDEEAVVARIEDKNKLGDQSFYKNAQNGDYLLMYNKAKVALIYREKDHKVIVSAPITTTNDSAGQPTTP